MQRSALKNHGDTINWNKRKHFDNQRTYRPRCGYRLIRNHHWGIGGHHLKPGGCLEKYFQN